MTKIKPEQKVPSVELCIELDRLKITEGIETYWVYVRYREKERDRWNLWILQTRKEFLEDIKRSGLPCCRYQVIPSPDFSELGELLPYRLKVNVIAELWIGDGITEPNTRAKTLIKLRELEGGL